MSQNTHDIVLLHSQVSLLTERKQAAYKVHEENEFVLILLFSTILPLLCQLLLICYTKSCACFTDEEQSHELRKALSKHRLRGI